MKVLFHGINCIFASHPNRVCSVPVKSGNTPVMSTDTTGAQTNLIFFVSVSPFTVFTVTPSYGIQ